RADCARDPPSLSGAHSLTSPRLNIREGEIFKTADGASVRTPVALFPLADIAGPGRPMRIGIRPEWLRLSTQPLPEAKALEVTLVEPLGAEILVHARWPSGELVARAPAGFAAPEHGHGWIDAQASQVDLFDSEGRRGNCRR